MHVRRAQTSLNSLTLLCFLAWASLEPSPLLRETNVRSQSPA